MGSTEPAPLLKGPICIGVGISGRIELLPSGEKVKKTPHPSADDYDKRWMRKHLAREAEIYRRLPEGHERLVQMFGHYSGDNSNDEDDGDSDDGNADYSIVLEYLPNGDLREFVATGSWPVRQRLQWALDAAEAAQLVHEHGIIHGDIKPPNFLVDKGLRLRIIDFSGSSIDGKPVLVVENARFFLPRSRRDDPSSVKTDLFALGSTIYEVMTGRQPYEDVDDDVVESRYPRGEFPALEGVVCGDVVRKCWGCCFGSARAVHEALVDEMTALVDVDAACGAAAAVHRLPDEQHHSD